MADPYFVPYPGCSALVPYTNADGSYNQLGGSCVEEVQGYGGVLYSPGYGHVAVSPYTPPPTRPGAGPGTWTAGGTNIGAPYAPQLAAGDPMVTYGFDVQGSSVSDPCSLVPGGPLAVAGCRWVQQQIANKLGNTGNTAAACPKGYHQTAQGCVIDGPGGYLPGDVGRPDLVWSPVGGRYGAGVSPVQVQASRLACPPGYALGKDNVCYDRISKSNRKWNPGAKPLLTGGDMNAIRTAGRAAGRLNRARKTLGKVGRRLAPARAARKGAPARKR